MGALTGRGKDGAFAVEIAGVEQLQVLVTQLPVRRQVTADVVKGAETPAEGDMAFVGEAGVTEDADAVLTVLAMSYQRVLGEVQGLDTLAMAAMISRTCSSLEFSKLTPITSAPKVGWSSLIAMVWKGLSWIRVAMLFHWSSTETSLVELYCYQYYWQ